MEIKYLSAWKLHSLRIVTNLLISVLMKINMHIEIWQQKPYLSYFAKRILLCVLCWMCSNIIMARLRLYLSFIYFLSHLCFSTYAAFLCYMFYMLLSLIYFCELCDIFLYFHIFLYIFWYFVSKKKIEEKYFFEICFAIYICIESYISSFTCSVSLIYFNFGICEELSPIFTLFSSHSLSWIYYF